MDGVLGVEILKTCGVAITHAVSCFEDGWSLRDHSHTCGVTVTYGQYVAYDLQVFLGSHGPLIHSFGPPTECAFFPLRV